jgi:hypothetical protein
VCARLLGMPPLQVARGLQTCSRYNRILIPNSWGQARQRCIQHRSSVFCVASQKKPGKKERYQLSVFEYFFRKSPVFSQFVDGTMVLGDSVMVFATQMACNRISFSDNTFIGCIMFLCWIFTAASKGDYKGLPPVPSNNVEFFNSGYPILAAAMSACATWALAITASVAVFSFLIAHNLLDAAPITQIPQDSDVAPETEVLVALLITMACWRSVLQRFRMFPI